MENNPYLCGNYAPVHDELNTEQLKVIGEIPQDLCGIYMRNGPNPAFAPISYTYPYDGDGMIHAVYLKEGKAQYRNRFIATKGLIKERRAGKALYGGLLQLRPMAPKWAEPEDEPVAIKNGAFIHIIRHAGNYLALSEGAAAYQLTADLKTIGEWNPNHSPKALELCAHTRLCPHNGDLWCINYALTPPFLSIYQFDKTGTMKQKWDIEKSYSSMIHDFVLTEHYVIVFDCPAVFDINQLMSGNSVLNWQPELGSRIGFMPRTGGSIQWIHTEPFFVFHFANAYEQDNQLIIDYVRHQQLVMLAAETNHSPPALYRTTINFKKNTATHAKLDDRIVEFPRIREEQNSLKHQYIYTLGKTKTIANPRAMNALIKYDLHNQQSQIHEFGNEIEIGEAVFADAVTKNLEDDGYLMLFTYNSTTDKSEFVILNAGHCSDKPIARIEMPRRIPNGLHGSWMPGEWDIC